MAVLGSLEANVQARKNRYAVPAEDKFSNVKKLQPFNPKPHSVLDLHRPFAPRDRVTLPGSGFGECRAFALCSSLEPGHPWPPGPPYALRQRKFTLREAQDQLSWLGGACSD